MHFFMINEPRTNCSRSTNTEGRRHFAPAGHGGKNINCCDMLPTILSERHGPFKRMHVYVAYLFYD